jgi:superfamily II DNA helicase RecQ
MEVVSVKKTANEFVTGKSPYWSVLVYHEDPESVKTKAAAKQKTAADAELSPEEREVYSALRQWRQDKATASEMPVYLICTNAELATVAKMKPRNLDDLTSLKGFGSQRVAKYGEDILSVLNAM